MFSNIVENKPQLLKHKLTISKPTIIQYPTCIDAGESSTTAPGHPGKLSRTNSLDFQSCSQISYIVDVAAIDDSVLLIAYRTLYVPIVT